MDIDSPNSLKRCLSAPMINNILQQTPVKQMTSTTHQTTTNSIISRENSPSIMSNVLTPRARRYSASFSPLSGQGNGSTGPRLTPRVSQLRQEECADISNSREVNHEREIHSTMIMSQSWEDLTLVAENLSCRGDDSIQNPLHVSLPIGPPVCSSPSPTRNGLRYGPYGLSPSPTRKTFQTRRSMSPIAMRPSSLGPVKRKFELDDCHQSYSPPPFKKAFTERGPSPICQTPSPICPSPDSYEGRTTPKLFPSRFCSYNTNSSSSVCSSPLTPSIMMEVSVDLNNTVTENQTDTIMEKSKKIDEESCEHKKNDNKENNKIEEFSQEKNENDNTKNDFNVNNNSNSDNNLNNIANFLNVVSSTESPDNNSITNSIADETLEQTIEKNSKAVSTIELI